MLLRSFLCFTDKGLEDQRWEQICVGWRGLLKWQGVREMWIICKALILSVDLTNMRSEIGKSPTQRSRAQKASDKHGEMSQQLTELLLLQRIQVQFPVPTWWLTTICNSNSKGSTASSDLFRTQHACCANICTQTHTRVPKSKQMNKQINNIQNAREDPTSSSFDFSIFYQGQMFKKRIWQLALWTTH